MALMTPEERALLGDDTISWQRKMELEMALAERAKEPQHPTAAPRHKHLHTYAQTLSLLMSQVLSFELTRSLLADRRGGKKRQNGS